jgi:hypothetical protein
VLTSGLPRLSLGRDLVQHRPADAAFRRLPELAEGEELELALGALLDRCLPWLRPPANGEASSRPHAP